MHIIVIIDTSTTDISLVFHRCLIHAVVSDHISLMIITNNSGKTKSKTKDHFIKKKQTIYMKIIDFTDFYKKKRKKKG